jgi:hypothetical protein
MHCWCPSATGPGQPHQSDCFQYKQPIIHAIGSASNGSSHDWDLIGGLTKEAVHKVYATFNTPFFGYGMTYQAQAYAMAPPTECACDHRFTATGHDALSPFGEKAESDAAHEPGQPDQPDSSDL